MAVLSKVANIAVQPQPVGVVEAFAGTNAPNGWLICDGSQVSRSLYPELFSVIGTTYGSGDGFSTFTLPDLRGRTIAGRDGVNNMNNGPTNRLTSTHFGASGTALGNSGGNEAHTLTTAQLPAHSHGITDPGHTHTVPYNTGPDTLSGPHTGNYDPNTYGGPFNYTTSSRTTGISIQNAGSGNAHNITQPTMILNYIIKAVSELPRGGWYNSSSPDLVTSLPTNPYVGQEVYHQQSGYPYHKRYNGATWDRTSNDIIICTSSTRPSSPMTGQYIYETDTNLEYVYTGSSWVISNNYGGWLTHNASLNFTLGNGTLSFKYNKIGRQVTCRIYLKWGSTTSASSVLTMSLPFAAVTFGMFYFDFGGRCTIHDAGTNLTNAICWTSDGNNVRWDMIGTGGTNATWNAGVTSTWPMTWVSGDELVCTFTYESTT